MKNFSKTNYPIFSKTRHTRKKNTPWIWGCKKETTIPHFELVVGIWLLFSESTLNLAHYFIFSHFSLSRYFCNFSNIILSATYKILKKYHQPELLGNWHPTNWRYNTFVFFVNKEAFECKTHPTFPAQEPEKKCFLHLKEYDILKKQ